MNYDDGSQGRYLHLRDVTVEVGWSVAAGGVIGHSNDTGGTTGPHLHYDHHNDRARQDAEDPTAVHGGC